MTQSHSTVRSARRLRPWLVSVVVLRRAGDQVETLLLKRKHHPAGTWCQVAGNIEQGETAPIAAQRELLEETGLTPTTFYSSDICEQFYEHHTDELVIAPVFVAEVAEAADVTLNDEHSEFIWLECLAASQKVTFPGQQAMFRHIHAAFVLRTPSPLLKLPVRA